MALFGEEELNAVIDEANNDIEKIIDKLERKLDLKLAQNKVIEIHNSVYKNPSADVQKKINKALSMEFAMEQAKAIENLNIDSTKGGYGSLAIVRKQELISAYNRFRKLRVKK